MQRFKVHKYDGVWNLFSTSNVACKQKLYVLSLLRSERNSYRVLKFLLLFLYLGMRCTLPINIYPITHKISSIDTWESNISFHVDWKLSSMILLEVNIFAIYFNSKWYKLCIGVSRASDSDSDREWNSLLIAFQKLDFVT